ncbi:hypothetical protein HN51_070820 [Arachis hypogaea]
MLTVAHCPYPLSLPSRSPLLTALALVRFLFLDSLRHPLPLRHSLCHLLHSDTLSAVQHLRSHSLARLTPSSRRSVLRLTSSPRQRQKRSSPSPSSFSS